MQKFNLLIEKLGGRKFFLVLFIFLITSLLFVFPSWGLNKTISKEEFVSLAKMLLLAYPLANIGQSLMLNSFPKEGEEVSYEDLIGGRKFSLILLMYVFFVIFTFFGLLTASTYVEFTQWLVGVYYTSNITSKAIENGLSISIVKKP